MKMYKGIADKVRLVERKNGIVYMDTDSVTYKVFKWIYILAFAFSLVINSIYILGATWENLPFVTPLICTIGLIAGLVFLCLKKHIISAILTLPSAVMIMLFFPHSLTYSNILNPKYYWAHLVPMIVLCLSILICGFIAVRANCKFKKTYEKVVDNLYNNYKIDLIGGEDIPEDKWEEFLENYDPYNYTAQFKSKKDKNDQ